MIIDPHYNDVEQHCQKPYDVVVIGAGTVGLLTAKLLADASLRVCVLDAGGRVVDHPSGSLEPISVGRPHVGGHLGRAIGLGGTSNLWGGQLSKFTPQDMTREGHEWPISFEELLPWYDQVSKALGTPRIQADADYVRAMGIEGLEKGALELFLTHWLPQPNLSKLFKEMLSSIPNVTVFLGATACGFDFEGSTASGVQVNMTNGLKCRIKGTHYVLAAGTLGNVQIISSACARGSVPWKDNPLIGAYFQDHLGGKIASVDVIDHKRFRKFFENGVVKGSKLQPKLRLVSTLKGVPAVSGFFAFRSSVGEQLDQFKSLVRNFKSGISSSDLKTLPRNMLLLSGVLGPIALRYIRQRRIMAIYDRGVDLLVQAEQWPIQESRISVASNEFGPSGLLPIQVDWRLDGREASAIVDFYEEAARVLEGNGLARLRASPWLYNQEELLLRRLEDTYHQSGGLRMSSTRRKGVTDVNCTVWGTSNLHVAGAAVMPSSSYANITFTSLALAARLADRLVRLRDCRK